jgi:DNA-binding LytR/AlgR family response regulator
MRHKCIIVDDEPPAIKVIKKYVDSVSQLELMGTCNNAFQTMELLSNQKVDLVFLDINMPKLMGTEMLRTLQHPPKVIFTTAHKDFAIEAFELDAIDYLLKPISFERFLKAVNKYCHVAQVENVLTENNSGFLYFRSDRKMVKVFLEEITFIESFKDYIIIHRQNNDDIKVKQTLSSVEQMLPHKMFVRIHRSYIVAFKKVTAFSVNEVEIGRVELPIGSSYSEVYKQFSPDYIE